MKNREQRKNWRGEQRKNEDVGAPIWSIEWRTLVDWTLELQFEEEWFATSTIWRRTKNRGRTEEENRGRRKNVGAPIWSIERRTLVDWMLELRSEEELSTMSKNEEEQLWVRRTWGRKRKIRWWNLSLNSETWLLQTRVLPLTNRDLKTRVLSWNSSFRHLRY